MPIVSMHVVSSGHDSRLVVRHALPVGGGCNIEAYAHWLAALPDSLRASSIAEALEAIVDLDFTDLADIELPRGYGRD